MQSESEGIASFANCKMCYDEVLQKEALTMREDKDRDEVTEN